MNKEIKALFVPQKISMAYCILTLNFIIMAALILAAQMVGNILFSTLCALLLATRYKCLNNIVHECAHSSFSNNKKFNQWIGEILSILLISDYTTYKRVHYSHHIYLGNYEKDLDFKAHQSLKHNETFTYKKIFIDIGTFKFIWFYLPKINLRNAQHIIGSIFYLLILAFLLMLSAYTAVGVLFFSLVFFLPLIKYAIDIVDHGGLYNDKVDEIYKSRNFIISNAILREILFPRNDCYHLIHHLYPYLPVRSFSKAHKILLKTQSYKKLQHRWKLMPNQKEKTCLKMN